MNRRFNGKTTVFGLAVCALATAALLAPAQQSGSEKITPFNVKTGLWQSTTTMTVMLQGPSGEIRQPHSSTQKGCVTQDDLVKDPFGHLNKNQDGMSCKENLIRSTGSDVEVEVTCTGEQMSSVYHMKLHASDQEHVTGSGEGNMSMMGRQVKSEMKFDSQWVQGSCPAHGE